MKDRTITSVRMEHVEAYVYCLDHHQGRPDWEDIKEKVHPLVAQALIDMGRLDTDDFDGEITIEKIADEMIVEDCLCSVSDDFKAQIFEKVLKTNGIFE